MAATNGWSIALPEVERLDSLGTALENSLPDTAALRIHVAIADGLIFVDPDSSNYHCEQALQLAETLKDTVRLAKVHNLFGIRDYVRSHYIGAIESFQKSYQLSLSCGDEPGANRAINNIGVMYASIEDHEASIRNYREAFELSCSIKDWETAALNLFNLSGAFLSLDSLENSWFYLDKLEAFQEKYNTSQHFNYLKAALYLESNELDSAMHYAELGLKGMLAREDQDLLIVGDIHLTFAEIWNRKGDFQQALQALDKATRIAMQLDYHEMLVSINEVRSEVFEKKGDFQSAYRAQVKYLSLRDSLETTNSNVRIDELNERYEEEKREREFAEMEASLFRKEALDRQQNIGFSAAGVLVLAIIGFLLYTLRRRKRMNRLLNLQNLEIRSQRQKILSSIDCAQKIQRSILIPEDTIREHLPESFVWLCPKDIVSGDFYWFDRVGENFLLSTIDCTGHGVPGAFMSLIAHNILNKVVREQRITEPAEILSNVHREMVRLLHQKGKSDSAKDGMDISLCLIQQDQRTISFAGAQNPIFLVRQDNLLEFKGDSLYLGGNLSARMNGAVSFNTQHIPYEPGDHLFMFTDGFMDQFGGPRNKKLNKRRFKEIILECARSTVSNTGQVLASALEQWKGRNAQLDDILVVGTKLN